MFKALVVDQVEKKSKWTFEQWSQDQLADKPVLVEVDYSSLNFKDGLAVTGKGKILHSFPMIPGIDLAGRVVESATDEFSPGDWVVLNGGGIGEDYHGGYAQFARVDAQYLVKLPESISTRGAMAIGTAGFTAMLAVLELEDAGVTPDKGVVAVSGAAGGVGSVAIAILSRLGYQVAAITGRTHEQDYLFNLGASEIVPRAEMTVDSYPLEKQRWAGAIDNTGDKILTRLLAQTQYGGAVASCGLAASHKLDGSVMPFILRAVKLLGINSTFSPRARRLQAWERLAVLFDEAFWDDVSQVICLDQVPEYAEKILAGKIRGRTVVQIK